jgi:SAM-dependent methyltransferase
VPSLRHALAESARRLGLLPPLPAPPSIITLSPDFGRIASQIGASAEEAAELALVDRAFHVRDSMCDAGQPDAYFRAGYMALRAIRGHLAHHGLAQPRRILDLPCGHGRVLRHLRLGFPQAEITACDLDSHGVSFCASRFGATPLASRPDIESLDLGRFDVVWCGSLISHFDAARASALLRFFHRSLGPGGMAVFSSHGRNVFHKITELGWTYGLDAAGIQRLLESYFNTGFGYAPYPGHPVDYGISLAADSWTRAAIAASGDWRAVRHVESEWDFHHDVYSLVRA